MDKVTTIEAYIDQFPEPARTMLTTMHALVAGSAPGATGKISYGIPTFYLHGNLVHFGGFKHHIGFYPTPAAMEAFKAELTGYQQAKGSVQFPHDQPLPVKLIERMVRFRVKENMALAKKARK